MNERVPGWHPDPWQDGYERRWDGTRWTADVRVPGTPGAPDVPPDDERGLHSSPESSSGDAPHPSGADDLGDPYAPGDEPLAEPRSPYSEAEHMVAENEGRVAGQPTMGGLPWGRYDDDPRSMRTTRMLLRAMVAIAVGFGIAILLWVSF
jgi:hypothetical protein